MNRKDLVKAIANHSNTSSAQVIRWLEAFEKVVADAVAGGDVVQIMGFGTFSTSRRPARSGHNPGTGEKIQVPAVTTVRFSAGSRFKLAVNRAHNSSEGDRTAHSCGPSSTDIAAS
ncbi:HU family DNA-binding protein [Ralstonia pickettii]|uniref:HU family DNA-binding protein n=2 Tax=Ralstonia pickettii TaxID=329 RepID=A0AAW4Q9Y1_RALPI|nr:HU family DNA-binding protein [Ralstonia pickettii]MBA9846611.1 DNA-binding protein [Ralstonia pickettii]MBA9851894.1 DNA-binding protein [Ralstonia pickettii]MBA9919749.1 DNA-binding protein [Ralstonia pickettii]MBA9958847.1 DNA-binding protein [Ralstonia pickettii]MBA9965036.1 DNA-binding protein [Ralstonia pickettii]